MLSCAGADRLQTGMRHAYGKAYAKAARVFDGSHLISIRTKEGNEHKVQEAFRRASKKITGKQRILFTNKWGFTKLEKKEKQKLDDEGRLITDGVNLKFYRKHG